MFASNNIANRCDYFRLQRYNKKCTFATKSRESLLSSAILLQMGCIKRPYFRGGRMSETNEVGALEGTTASLNGGCSPHSFVQKSAFF